MSFLGGRVARQAPVVDLVRLGLDSNSLLWLEARLGTTEPKLSAIDSLEQAELADDERIFMAKLRDALRGGGRNVTTTVSSSGSAEADRIGVVEIRLNPQVREADPVLDVREAMPNGLWGHEQHLDAFTQVASDYASQSRALAAIMALGGDRGHGKDQAVKTLARGLFGQKGAVVTVDFAGLSDASVAALFAENGALAPASLKSDVGRAVVCLKNAEGLALRAPTLARRLVELLNTERGTPAFHNVPFVIDLVPANGRSTLEELVQALGSGSASLASTDATFTHLDDAVAQRYGLARLSVLLRTHALKHVRVDFDQAALDVLAKALGTPHAPLDDIDLRLHRLALSHLERADVGKGAEPVTFQFTVALSEEQAAPLIDNLRSPIPALKNAEKLLRIAPVVFGSVVGESAASVVADEEEEVPIALAPADGAAAFDALDGSIGRATVVSASAALAMLRELPRQRSDVSKTPLSVVVDTGMVALTARDLQIVFAALAKLEKGSRRDRVDLLQVVTTIIEQSPALSKDENTRAALLRAAAQRIAAVFADAPAAAAVPPPADAPVQAVAPPPVAAQVQAAAAVPAAVVKAPPKPVRQAPAEAAPRMPHSPATVQLAAVGQGFTLADDSQLFTPNGASALAALRRATNTSDSEYSRNHAADEFVLSVDTLSANAAILLLNRSGYDDSRLGGNYDLNQLTPELAAELRDIKPRTRACARAILVLRKVQYATERDKELLRARAAILVGGAAHEAFEEAFAIMPPAPANTADADRFVLDLEHAVVTPKRDVAASAFAEATRKSAKPEKPEFWQRQASIFVENVSSMSPHAARALFGALPADLDAREVLFAALPKIACANDAERTAIKQLAYKVIKLSVPNKLEAGLKLVYAKADELLAGKTPPQQPRSPQPPPPLPDDIIPPVDQALVDEVLGLLEQTVSDTPHAHASLFTFTVGQHPEASRKEAAVRRLKMALRAATEAERFNAACSLMMDMLRSVDVRIAIAILQNVEVGIDRSAHERPPWVTGLSEKPGVHAADVALAFALLQRVTAADAEQRATLRKLITRIFEHSCAISGGNSFRSREYPALLDAEIANVANRAMLATTETKAKKGKRWGLWS